MSQKIGNPQIIRWIGWFVLFLLAGIAGIAAIRVYRGEPIDAAVFFSRAPFLVIIAGALVALQVARDLRKSK